MDLTAGRPPPVFDRLRRSAQTEILDEPVDPKELAVILRDLARFNGAMMGHRPVLRWLARATCAMPVDRPLTLLDVGCGYGDLLRAIRRWARKQRRPMRLVGIDLNPAAVDIARQATDVADEIEYHAADVFAFAAPRSDLIVTSLVAHHLADSAVVRFVQWMDERAQKGWMVYDLQRSIVPFYFVALAGAAMRLHAVVTYDGRVSVARSLTRREWCRCLADAGIAADAVDLRWFMFRFCIGRLK